jgi:hypothetical protein
MMDIFKDRLYGPAVFPLMLKSAKILVNAGLHVIANIDSNANLQIMTMKELGLTEMSLGALLWVTDPIRIITNQ